MKTNPRRDFLKKSILGVSGAALMPGVMNAGGIKSNDNIVRQAIPVRTLGKTGLKLPLISMGTGDCNNPALIKGALDNGIKLFGTSAYYGNGNNETLLGGVFKTLPRESFLVATSAMPKGTDHQKGLFTDPNAGPDFQRDVEAGMKRLGVDYLDILFLPFAAKRESVFFEPLLKVMQDFKKSGKARYIGIATHSFVGEAIRAAADTGVYDVVMAAYNFRLEQMQEINEAVAYGAAAGLGLICMKSMAGGYWDQARTQPISSGAALKWVMQNENMHTIMSGMTTFEELQKNMALMQDIKLTPEDLKDIKLAQHADPGGLYCLQCGNCSGQCPQNVDIPTLMRSYMYAYGYRNFDHAQQTLNLVNLSGKPCDNCEVCSVRCTSGFDVKNKIQNIARLRDVPREFLMA